MLATAAVTNVVSSLAALMTRACSDSRAEAETYVVAALARRVFAAASGEGTTADSTTFRATTGSPNRRRRRALLAEPPPLNLGDPVVALEVTESAVTEAWNSGALASRDDVPPAAINGVSDFVARGVAHLREAGSAATEDADPLSVHRAAAAVAAVMQDPKVEIAIAAASVPDDGSGSANESLTLLVELAEPDAFSARVQQAESTVTVQIPESAAAAATPNTASGTSVLSERCSGHPSHPSLGHPGDSLDSARRGGVTPNKRNLDR